MHLQAIVTKYHGPTTYKGARVSAKASAGKIITDWDHSLNVNGNHAAAAQKLAEKMGWGGHWVSGGLPEGNGDVFVCAARESDLLNPTFTPDFSTTAREG